MEKDIQQRIDLLLKQKNFSELEGGDKEFILEHFESSESYEEFRKAIMNMAESAYKVPDSTIKKDLISKMKARNKSALLRLFEFKTPLYANFAALTLVIISFFIFRPIQEVIVEKTKTVEITSLPDTVYLEAEPDTIIQEKLIRVEVPVYLTEAIPEEEISYPVEEEIEMTGSNLSDHQVLRGLITSSP